MGANIALRAPTTTETCAFGYTLPMPVPLGVAKMAVQHGHFAETRAETLDRLRRETDFRHQNYRLAAEVDHLLYRLNVDLGFAAVGHPVDQDWFVLAGINGTEDRGKGFMLIGVQDEVFFTLNRRCGILRHLHTLGLCANQALAAQGGDGPLAALGRAGKFRGGHRRSGLGKRF